MAADPLAFVRSEIRLSDGRTVGKALATDPWIEAELLRPAFARDGSGLPSVRMLYLELPRGHAKSFYGAGIATAEAVLADSTDVVIAAGDRDQAVQVRLDSEVGWVPLTPPRFLPGHISASVSGGGRCGQPDVNIFNEAFFSCAVGSLAKGASVQMTVSFEIGRIAGRHLTVDTSAHTASRDPNIDNSEDTADTAMTGCHPSYPSNDLCIAPPPPDLTCDDLDPYTDIHVDWAVADPDPHHLDADHDGIGCES
jgi:hypothetical protein